jgi:hypothetical protein
MHRTEVWQDVGPNFSSAIPHGATKVAPYFRQAGTVPREKLGGQSPYSFRSRTPATSWSASFSRIKCARSRVGSMFSFRFG